MPTVFLNGVFVDALHAQVSAFDAGFQHAVGLFETLLAKRDPASPRGVRVVHLHEHLSRLAESARALALTERLHVPALAEGVERTCVRALADMPQAERFRVRLTISGGDLNLLQRAREGASAPAPQQPTLLIVAQPATHYPGEMFAAGVLATIADLRVSPLDETEGHKTLHYWHRLRALQRAGARGGAEALVFQVTNHLVGGCVSSAILVKDGGLIAPIARGEEGDAIARNAEARGPAPHAARASDGGDEPPAPARRGALPSPVLPGIVRAWALQWAEDVGRGVRRKMVSIDDVLGADEVILTNSSWGALAVTRVEGSTIGDGRPGEVALALREAWERV